ncbi:MAG: hypothetical protein IT433_10725 [Phycisphaerales bacterium]|nr:hypothetical protein [Phycisphaerales bacterium]
MFSALCSAVMLGFAGMAFGTPPSLVEPGLTAAVAETGTPQIRARVVVPTPAAGEAAVGTELTLNLFDDCSPVGVVRKVHHELGFAVVEGSLDGEAEGSFLLVAGRGVVTGEVRSPSRGAFEIRPAPGGLHVARELREPGFATCATDHEHEVDAGGAAGRAGEGGYGERGLPNIRVMVVYTPLARDDEGGDAAMQARVVFAISQANTAYVNSQAQAHLTLAYTGAVEYEESGSAGTDLSCLRSTSDGFMDVVHCIRNTVAADMVALMVNNFNACGIGYLQTNPGPGFQSSAFTVTDKDCISNYTFAHELGHNMGCAHDRDNGSSAAYSYAFGYRTPDQVYRTIMAYAPGTRIARFSNPDITFNGYVMGIPLGQTGETHNALCITNTSPVIEAFRSGNGSDADVNQDGNVDQDDVTYLINVVGGGANPTSINPDFNTDGNADQDDVLALINAVAGGGCP